MPAQHDDAHAREGRLLGAVLDRQHLVAALDFAAMIAAEAHTEGLADLTLYLQDYDQLALLPLPAGSKERDEESIAGSVPGRAFAANTAVEVPAECGGTRIWLPMLNGTDRVGVLGVTVEHVDDDIRRLARRLTGLVAELLVAKGQYTDHFFRVRRRQATTLAAEMQWHLLPPLMLQTQRVAVAGIVEPAYAVGGDAFDYAINMRRADELAAVGASPGHHDQRLPAAVRALAHEGIVETASDIRAELVLPLCPTALQAGGMAKRDRKLSFGIAGSCGTLRVGTTSAQSSGR